MPLGAATRGLLSCRVTACLLIGRTSADKHRPPRERERWEALEWSIDRSSIDRSITSRIKPRSSRVTSLSFFSTHSTQFPQSYKNYPISDFILGERVSPSSACFASARSFVMRTRLHACTLYFLRVILHKQSATKISSRSNCDLR